MKLDINRVWQEASAMVSANREVLLTVAGVFFVLPALVIGWLYPAPEIAAEMQPRALLAMASEYLGKVAPWQVMSMIASAAGSLTLLALMTGRERPTVGAAIGEGLRGVLTYLATTILVMMVFLGGALVVALVAASSGSAIAAVLLMLPLLAVGLYLSIRWNLVAPVIALEAQRNPISALQRSWLLTRGNVGPILLYLFLIAIIYIIVAGILTAIVAALLALALGAEAGRFAGVLMGSVLGGIFIIYLTASLGAMYRQLTGAPDETARKFD